MNNMKLINMNVSLIILNFILSDTDMAPTPFLSSCIFLGYVFFHPFTFSLPIFNIGFFFFLALPEYLLFIKKYNQGTFTETAKFTMAILF